MRFSELFLLALGLSMDAFAVAVCKGLAVDRLTWRQMLAAGMWFGGFQALMPLLGYFLGAAFEEKIAAVDHWVAFALLVSIGGNMLYEAHTGGPPRANASFSPRTMLPLAVATSVDALAVGITLGLLPDVPIWSAVAVTGVTTCLLSALGVKVGNVFGRRYEAGAQRLGGAILILLGVKLLLEHLGVLPVS